MSTLTDSINDELKAVNKLKTDTGSEVYISVTMPDNANPTQSVMASIQNVWTSVRNKTHLYKDESEKPKESAEKKEEGNKQHDINFTEPVPDKGCHCIIL
jgi:hypothetical protein